MKKIDYPEPLSKEESYFYFKKYKAGDLEAKEKLIMHNMRLVIKRINTKFKNVDYNYEDLISIGTIGLIKSIDTFALEKNFAFSSYATKVIDNEILKFLYKLKKIKKEDSLYAPINEDETKILVDVLKDLKVDLIKNYEKKEIIIELNRIVNSLPDLEKEIIKLYFGFYENMPELIQKEIGTKLGIAQSSISRITKKTILKIRKELIQKEFIDSSLVSVKKLTKNI